VEAETRENLFIVGGIELRTSHREANALSLTGRNREILECLVQQPEEPQTIKRIAAEVGSSPDVVRTNLSNLVNVRLLERARRVKSGPFLYKLTKAGQFAVENCLPCIPNDPTLRERVLSRLGFRPSSTRKTGNRPPNI
jgi:DNA-binding CsgD family transcriptional regulator